MLVGGWGDTGDLRGSPEPLLPSGTLCPVHAEGVCEVPSGDVLTM